MLLPPPRDTLPLTQPPNVIISRLTATWEDAKSAAAAAAGAGINREQVRQVLTLDAAAASSPQTRRCFMTLSSVLLQF